MWPATSSKKVDRRRPDAARADAEDEQAGRTALDSRRGSAGPGALGRLRPGQCRGGRPDAARSSSAGRRGAEHGGQGPGRGSSAAGETAGGRGRSASGRPAGRRASRRPLLVHDIDGGEGDVLRALRQDAAPPPGTPPRPYAAAGAWIPELAQRLQPPGPDHLSGDLGAGAEDAIDCPAVGREDRAVREPDVDLLPREVAGEEEDIVEPARSAGAARRPRASGRWGPRSRPRPPAPAGRGARVLDLAQEGDVGVVIQDGQAGSPPEHDGEADVRHRLMARRRFSGQPAGRAQVGARPVEAGASVRPSRCRPGSIARGPSVDRWRPSHRRRPPDLRGPRLVVGLAWYPLRSARLFSLR